ncbi:MAG: aldo/keto reductase [Acholeplasmataceae bacterium]
MDKTLHNGVKMPQFGLGTFLIEAGDSAYDSVSYALSIGYRHIDTAQAYNNEASIGQAIKDSKIPRSEIFITTKQRMHGDEKTMEKAFLASLEKLQTDYVDLYLIHWPNHDNQINQQTWAFFEKLYREKKVRAIGVSNFQIHHLKALFKTATIKPMVNQVECHPGLQQVPLKTFLDQHNIALESYGPFMKGNIFEPPFLNDLDAIAKVHEATIPQVVIAWGLARDIIFIPKSGNHKRILENFEGTQLKLTGQELKQIDNLNRGKRVYTDPDNSPWGYNYETS